VSSRFEQFREELREALAHLHHPDYRPPPLLRSVLSRTSGDEASPVQSVILHAIRRLEPQPDVAPDARARRDFDVLHNRFVVGLTQEQAAEKMHMSERSMRRAQREATHTLACFLWEGRLAHEMALPATAEAEVGGDDALASWRSQVRQDLASLQTGRPGSVSHVAECIAHSSQLVRDLLARYSVELRVEPPPSDVAVPVHPALLRQVLIAAIGQLARSALPGPLTLCAVAQDDQVHLTLSAQAAPEAGPPDVTFAAEILALQGGTIEAHLAGCEITMHIRLPAVGTVNVLVIDDNVDLLYFYRRCARGTRYHMLHAPEGQRTLDAIVALRPDVIILDILLPDADGWELLAGLRSHPLAQRIPVIICSIVREEELAQAFGAALYLPKPVDCAQLIQALDQVLGPGPAAASRGSTSRPAVC